MVEVKVGDRYYVKWRDGQTVGEVIEKRLKKNGSNDKQLAPSNPAAYEYYVHFITYDRRLDEWVTYDRVDTKTQVAHNHGDNGEDSKYKRHKRKLDNEIHDNKEKETLGMFIYSLSIYPSHPYLLSHS